MESSFTETIATSDATSIGDFEDFTPHRLGEADVISLIGTGGVCVLSWTTADGYPVGVVMHYLYRDGRFWLNCVARRARVAALRVRPQAAVVVNKEGKMASFKSDAVIHAAADADWNHVSKWFYDAFSGLEVDPADEFAAGLRRFLDGLNTVVIEVPANLVVSHDSEHAMNAIQGAISRKT